jgi:hypothetical protein
MSTRPTRHNLTLRTSVGAHQLHSQARWTARSRLLPPTWIVRDPLIVATCRQREHDEQERAADVAGSDGSGWQAKLGAAAHELSLFFPPDEPCLIWAAKRFGAVRR